MQDTENQNKTPTNQENIISNDCINLQLSLDWQSNQGHHSETRIFYDLNLKQHLDQLPSALHPQILNMPISHDDLTQSIAGPQIKHDNNLVKKINISQFKQLFHGRKISPLVGRFYPQTIIDEIENPSPNNLIPMRLIDTAETHLLCDFNHPLAGKKFDLSAKVISKDAASNYPAHKADPLKQLLKGPGMQVRAQRQPTDFLSGNPFRRKDESSDAAFYHMPRIIDHLDRNALKEVARLYGRLIPQNANILDLMSSTNSHLPDALSAAKVTGLGMNQQELDSNPQLSTSLIQDLNNNPELPFPSASFDAVICTVSVEYLTRPLEVFQQVNRVLKPAGIFINTFSNRWFPPKVIELWTELHEFERMGLVSEYFLQSGNYGSVDTYSIQGLRRPQDDIYANQLPWSDPIFAVWSRKNENGMSN